VTATMKPMATRFAKAACVAVGILAWLAVAAPGAGAQWLDFGWSRPVAAAEVKPSIGAGDYLIWPIQITNNSPRVLSPSISVVAVTNTGRQYTPLPFVAVAAERPRDEVFTLEQLKSEMFPAVRRRAAVVFEDVDPDARQIRFYVRGLVRPGPQRVANGGAYVMVTFERMDGSWVWVNTDFLE